MIDASVLATFTAHGGRVAAARAVFGGAGGGDDWIDLSTGLEEAAGKSLRLVVAPHDIPLARFSPEG